MSPARGRPAVRKGLDREDIIAAALGLLDDNGGQGLTMRALAARLGVTPMSLYRHVEDRAGLLRALSDRVYRDVLGHADREADDAGKIRTLLLRYYDAVARHRQLTLAIFAEPQAFAGVSRQITDRLTTLVAAMTHEHVLWRDILVDHAHGSALALVSAQGNEKQAAALREQYRLALHALLARLGTARAA